MKNITKLFAIAVVILGFSATSFGQNATATANAAITNPFTLTLGTNPMEFGTLAVDPAGGSIILHTDGTTTPTDVAVVTGTPTAADFTVSGPDGFDYNISLPATITVTGPTETMTISALTARAASKTEDGTTGKLHATTGDDTFTVGGTLTVGPDQAEEVYKGTFDVTVNF